MKRERGGCAGTGKEPCSKPANVMIDSVPYCPQHAAGVLLAVYGVYARPVDGYAAEERVSK